MAKPGMSNAGKYPNTLSIGPKGTYPIAKTGSNKIDAARVHSALRLLHYLPEDQEVAARKKLKGILKSRHKMQGLANRIVNGKLKD